MYNHSQGEAEREREKEKEEQYATLHADFAQQDRPTDLWDTGGGPAAQC